MAALLERLRNLRWVPSSDQEIRIIEERLLEPLNGQYTQHMVQTPLCDINTISYHRPEHTKTILLLHGFGFGCVQWVPNWHSLTAVANVHAIDLPGFGCSGHPKFSGDTPEEALLFFVQLVEEWLKAYYKGLGCDPQPVILVGHSFGGYIAGHFAANYPHRLKGLILVDAFGINGKPSEEYLQEFYRCAGFQQKMKIWTAKTLFYQVGVPTVLRAAGPLGKHLLTRKQPTMTRNFRNYVANPNDLTDYLYHANVASRNSGWNVFSLLLEGMGAHIGEGFWVKIPVRDALCRVKDAPMLFVCGDRSWVDPSDAQECQRVRSSRYPQSATTFTLVSRAGHHVYLDNPREFNNTVAHWVLQLR
jgi:pimeloyl-ACP methyl ester carboxylesterase